VSVVLVVEDDFALRWMLHASLHADDVDVLEAGTGEEALTVAARTQADAVVLDLGLPGIDGLEMLRRLRAFSDIPVVVVSVRDGLADKVAALDAGADDYVVKPFETDELLARVRAHLRRSPSGRSPLPVFQADALEIDLDRRLVTWGGLPLQLTAVETRLLEMLLRNRGRLLTHNELLDGVWGTRPQHGHDRLRVTVGHLRRKLHDDAANPQLIFTEPGLGYRWIGEQEHEDSNL
jgi:two-component system KDP operon response regulator KdpE